MAIQLVPFFAVGCLLIAWLLQIDAHDPRCPVVMYWVSGFVSLGMGGAFLWLYHVQQALVPQVGFAAIRDNHLHALTALMSVVVTIYAWGFGWYARSERNRRASWA